MLRTSVLALGLLTAGCAAPAETLPGNTASPEAGRSDSTETVVSLAPLAPAPRPDLPAPLRPDAPTEAAIDHAAHVPSSAHLPMATNREPTDHGTMDHSEAVPPLALTLDAYLGIQEALAADDLTPVRTRAQAFADAWSRATDRAPDADPHFWHTRVDDVAAVRTHALRLADAASLDGARMAFGHLSAPFLVIVEAHGAPAGYDLSRFTCGMREDLPEGGVWLQRGAEPRNPYFGTRMLACATRSAPDATPDRTGDLVAPEPSGAMDHGTMNHTGHDG